MFKVVLLLFLSSTLIQASEIQNQFLIYENCKSENCFQLRDRFQPRLFSIEDKIPVKVKIHSAMVVKDPKSDNYSISIEIYAKKLENLKDKYLVYKHQVLSHNLIRNFKNQSIARVTFKKETTLKNINKECMEINKKCKWISELNRY